MTSPVYQHVAGSREEKSGRGTRWLLLVVAAGIFSLLVPTPKAWAQG
jgi:hypothetical protein